MYKCLSKERYEDDRGYSLIPIRKENMEPIRVWRNAQMHILRQQTPISPEEQQKYFSDVLQPTFTMDEPPQILFGYYLGKLFIGYGGLTHIEWASKRAEISFLLDTPRNTYPKNFQEDFRHYLKLIMNIAFSELKLHRLFTETYSFRTDVMLPLEEAGFRLEGRLREHVFKRGQWMDSMMHGIIDREVK